MYEPYGFSGLVDQNRADTQSGAFAPTMPGYTGLDRMQFADMRTPEDQIHWLYLKIIGYMANAVSPEEMQAALDEAEAKLKEYVDAQDNAIKADVQAKYVYLIDLIHKFGQFAGSVYDPTQGVSWIVDEVLEHVYDFDRTCSLTAADYDAMRLGAEEYDKQGVNARWYDVAGALWFWDNRVNDATGNAVSFNFLTMLVDKLTGAHVDPVNSIAPKTVTAAPYAVDETAVAIGNNSTAQGKNSVALGAGSDASEPNVVAVSGSGIERRIVGVAEPVNDEDAANKKYVDEHQADLTEVNARISAVDTRVTEVEGAETQNTKDIATLKGDVAQNTADIVEAKATLETDGTNIEQLQSDVEGLKARPTGATVNSIAPLTVDYPPLAQANIYNFGNNNSAVADSHECVLIGAENKKVRYGSRSVAIGFKNRVGAVSYGSDPSIAIGYNNSATDSCISIGNNISSSPYRVVIGTDSASSGSLQNSVGIGMNITTAAGAVAVGSMASCSKINSVAIGYQSGASREKEFSIGNPGYSDCPTRFLANVTDPELDQDAATKHYVDAAIAAIPTGSDVNNIAPAKVSSAPTTGGPDGVAIGNGAQVAPSEGVAIGVGAACMHRDSIAIGNGSTTGREGEFSVGISPGSDGMGQVTRFVANVKEPVKNSDAATKAYADTVGQDMLAEAQGAVNTLDKTKVTPLQSTVNTQATTITELQSTIETLNVTVTNQAGMLATLQSTAASQASTIETLQSQIAALSAKITEIDDSWKGQY